MRTRWMSTALVVGWAGLAALPALAADDYKVDPNHSSVSFKISHGNLSSVHGRFDKVSGQFTIDEADPSKSSFEFTLQTNSIDTNNPGRDRHLRSPDFFNADQFPSITFHSTSVKPVDGGYEVTGDLTMHGTTKSITVNLKGGNKVQPPRGNQRTGFVTDFTLKRSDFGVGSAKFNGMLGDEVPVSIGIEGEKR